MVLGMNSNKHQLYVHSLPLYGTKVQMTEIADTLLPLSPQQITHLKESLEILLC